VTFIDPTTVEFQLVRPASVVPNPSGEVVSAKVVLPDAGCPGLRECNCAAAVNG
jgi:hypothetical protein